MIHNVMELLVDQRLDHFRSEEKDTCKCPKCMEDVKCLTLNKLPPKYVSSDQGELFSKVSSVQIQSTMDIDVAIINGFETVRLQPRHSSPVK